MQTVEDAHTRFDYFKDDRKMHNKVKDPRYDLTRPKNDTEDEYVTTDMDDSDIDPEDRHTYRKYRALQSMNEAEVKDYDEVIKKFNHSAKA